MMDSPMSIYVSYLNNENIVTEPKEIILDKKNIECTDLQSKITDAFGISTGEYKLFFGLKQLDCDKGKKLSDFGLRCGSRLHAIQKKEHKPRKEIKIPEFSKVQNAVTMLRDVQHNQVLKSAVVKFFNDRESMDRIISSIDGLSSDKTAVDILNNIKLFKVMINPGNVKNIIKKHPCLASAFVAIWNSLLRNPSFVAPSSRLLRGPDASQDFNMEVDDGLLTPPSDQASTSRGNRNLSRIITSSQLASALAQATSPGGGAAFPYSAFNTPNSSNTHSPMPNTPRSATSTPSGRTPAASQRPSITPDVFSQAMQQALVSTGLQEVAESLQSDRAAASHSSLSEDVLQAGLNQLRAMGITDEEASRQALTVTQGNVEAAINLLFSGN